MGLFGKKNTGAIIRVQEASYNWDCEDPFYFAVYHHDDYPQGNEQQAPPKAEIDTKMLGNDYTKFMGYRMYKGKVTPGFPLHTHWGYETITYVSKGYVDHFDSLGNQGRFGYGDMQWITASSRYGHCEMYPLAYNDKPNPQIITQICLNLPLKDKHRGHQVRTIWQEEIPVYEEENWKAYVLIGSFKGLNGPTPNDLSWAADPSHKVKVVRIRMKKETTIELEPTDAASRSIYICDNPAIVEGKEIHQLSRVKLDPTKPVKIETTDKGTEVWLLEGNPIGERQYSYGPLIVGSEKEVRDGLNVVREKQEADWPWEFVNQKQPLGTHRFFQDKDGNRSEPIGPAPEEGELPEIKAE